QEQLVEHVPEEPLGPRGGVVASARRLMVVVARRELFVRGIAEEAPHRVVEIWVTHKIDLPRSTTCNLPAHDCVEPLCTDHSCLERVHVQIANDKSPVVRQFRFLVADDTTEARHRLGLALIVLEQLTREVDGKESKWKKPRPPHLPASKLVRL